MLKVANSVINVSQITGVLPVVNGGTGVTTSTGTGNTVLSASPTLSGDVSLSTGNLVIGTSGKGIAGTTTNNNADAGVVGEYIEATFSLVTVTTAPANMASISLTAGDWDVSYRISTGGASATSTSFYFSINTTSATLGTQGVNFLIGAVDVVGGGACGAIPVKRISIASTTTVYGIAATIAGTMVNTTGVLSARRVR